MISARYRLIVKSENDLVLEIWIIYSVLGVVAGVLAGLLGIGGGLIIVPVLYEVFTQSGMDPSVNMQVAIATSLAIILVTSVSSTYTHHLHGAVLWPVFWSLTPGIMVGAIVGAGIAGHLSTLVLIIFFGVFELFVAYKMWFAIRPDTDGKLPDSFGMFMFGGVIGSVSAIVGIGGGTITVPFLVWCKKGMRYAVATSSACGFPVALAGVTTYFFLGQNEGGLPDQSYGYIYFPAFLPVAVMSLIFAPAGAKLAHILPVVILKKIFAILLLIIALRLLAGVVN